MGNSMIEPIGQGWLVLDPLSAGTHVRSRNVPGVTVVGVRGHLVAVEAHVGRGLPSLTLTGLPGYIHEHWRRRATSPSDSRIAPSWGDGPQRITTADPLAAYLHIRR
jgi:hypothetical protein